MTDPEPTATDGLPERPLRIRLDEPLAPRKPWSFWREALPGGFSGWGLHLILAWVLFQALGSAAWAVHLRGFIGFGPGQAGGSGLPSHWGGILTSRDVWEILENGGLKQNPLGHSAFLLGLAALAWVLWAGWKLQAERAGSPGRLRPWLLGGVDALLIGLLPLLLLWSLFRPLLAYFGGLGFTALGWLDLAGGALLRLALVSLFMLQWWFCRLARDRAAHPDFRLGGWKPLALHLQTSFQRLWLHPLHWGSMALVGTLLRLGLALLVLGSGWRMGGDGSGRVWAFLLLQLSATAMGAWLLGWFLRVAALFFVQDSKVRQARRDLEAGYGQPETSNA